ncbi:hypothetical protein NEHOM01_1589 [Nematocida homosporus]|uniref:uncharacterized protein n=1 Tax=Nematocida homosporus TaxID=1912981 RepID=UPI0022204D8E|nr:uncharacterized protein NEHOM01_1589 [Nematocida homosporus]KAI5186621.1 hypothetical protein NEHOM01_1589 [Nematocida homosporus]
MPPGHLATTNTLALVLGCICQEINSQTKDCEEFGYMLGEKIAEEAVFHQWATGKESTPDLIFTLFLKIFPNYFASTPQLNPNSDKQETQVNFQSSPLLTHCHPDSFLNLTTGFTRAIFHRLLLRTVKIQKDSTTIQLTIAWN